MNIYTNKYGLVIHCTHLHIWERRNGITKKQKRSKRNYKRKKLRSSTTQPRIVPTISTTSSPQNRNSPRVPTRLLSSTILPMQDNHPFHALLMASRPTNAPHPPMWLILCTCNFLHSGGWSSFIRQLSSLELDFYNFSSTCNFNFNFFATSFSLNSSFTT
ncbi:unnamed protein product [Rhizophagus irregularis]|uniref:Uncharacterized protein n=1 Tax=Rhizophagus irregularis TaxID=588596 RepID=A0A2I1HNJ5_9GLOM|nr:hypothetical protein RhiirA4_484143 [Rhizophagus irregularis]CAB4445565.1 unnamed protein product [Rhizophagus irregularis]